VRTLEHLRADHYGGRIEVITGSMFSGKSEELIRRLRRALFARQRVQVFKSALDDRYHGIQRVSSHDGTSIEAIPIKSSSELAAMADREAEVIGVDEAQFLDQGIVEVVGSLADRGIRVLLAGIDLDFRGEPFGPMPGLLAVAETVDKLHAVCVRCAGPASRTQLLVDGRPAPYHAPTIQIGGAEKYEARCRTCHEVPTENPGQVSLLEELDGPPAPALPPLRG
jgi:thymidine kinase